MKIRTHHNYDHNENRKKPNTDPSLTIPGESYTIRELIKRYDAGLIDKNQHIGEYQEDVTHDDPDIQKIAKIDRVDRQMLTDQNKEAITNLRTKIQSKVNDKAKIKAIEEEKAKIDKQVPKEKVSAIDASKSDAVD